MVWSPFHRLSKETTFIQADPKVWDDADTGVMPSSASISGTQQHKQGVGKKNEIIGWKGYDECKGLRNDIADVQLHDEHHRVWTEGRGGSG